MHSTAHILPNELLSIKVLSNHNIIHTRELPNPHGGVRGVARGDGFKRGGNSFLFIENSWV